MGKHPLLDKWSQAVASADLEKVLSLYEEDALLRSTLSPDICKDLLEIRAYFEDFLNKGITEVSYTVEAELFLDHALVLMGCYQFKKTDSYLQALFTFVLKESAAGYQILAHHSSLLEEA